MSSAGVSSSSQLRSVSVSIWGVAGCVTALGVLLEEDAALVDDGEVVVEVEGVVEVVEEEVMLGVVLLAVVLVLVVVVGVFVEGEVGEGRGRGCCV